MAVAPAAVPPARTLPAAPLTNTVSCEGAGHTQRPHQRLRHRRYHVDDTGRDGGEAQAQGRSCRWGRLRAERRHDAQRHARGHDHVEATTNSDALFAGAVLRPRIWLAHLECSCTCCAAVSIAYPLWAHAQSKSRQFLPFYPLVLVSPRAELQRALCLMLCTCGRSARCAHSQRDSPLARHLLHLYRLSAGDQAMAVRGVHRTA